MIENSGEIDYELDKMGRISTLETQYHSQMVFYDDIGRISKISWNKFFDEDNQYSYDDLNQIKSEAGHFSNNYENDSHFNRLKKNESFYEINDLNEVISTDLEAFEYDKNGNIIERKSDEETVKLYYDDLDRLIKVEKPNVYILKFKYDPFNRRISKKVLKNSYLGWKKDFRYFLYDEQNEIGSFDKLLKQKELRILSDSQTAEIGSAIAFEIDGYIYVPIYDVSGNVASLIYNGSLYEHYRYSAFGERKIYSSWGFEKNASQINNPWQFSSKRIDEETGYIYYGRRYYDPNLGRWITPDPKGFVDGLNLYAFVSNNPLTTLDLYGLEKNSIMPSYDYNNSFHENLQNIDHSMMQGAMKFGSDIFMGMLRQFGYSETFQMQSKTLEMIKNKPFSTHYAQFIDYTAHKLAAFDYSNPHLSKLSRHTTNSCHVAAIACGGRFLFEKVLNRLGRSITPEVNTFQSFERAFENKALSGLNFKQMIKNVKKFGNPTIIKINNENYSFTKHALERMMKRKINNNDVANAISKPLKINDIVVDRYNRPSQRIIGKYAEVVINPKTNNIISVNPTSSRKAQKLLKILEEK